ncbi:peptidase M24 [Campylobacterota bacterium]|nr:peptidase M24 [Campylobacterota bacterium]
MRLITLFFAALCAVFGFSVENASYPGGIAVVYLDGLDDLDANLSIKPVAFFGEKRLKVIEQDGKFAAIVAISLDTAPNQNLEISYEIGGETKKKPFFVGDKQRKIQRLTIDKKMEALDEQTLLRVANERKIVSAAIGEFSQDLAGAVEEAQFGLPLLARISGNFGARRIINGEARRPHAGTDIAAPLNTVVKAPQNGVAALVGSHFYCGNFVLLNHGEGLFTLYCHLESALVEQEASVQKGEKIALVGKSGRVTGAHLHWSAALNGVWFDPLLLVSPTDNKKLTMQK